MTTEYPDGLKKFFNELETRRTLLTTITNTHNKLINDFISLDETLTKRSQILDTQIENFKKNTVKNIEALTVRETSLPETEVTLASRVEQLKDAGIRDIERGNNLNEDDKTISGMLRMWFRRMDSKNLMKFLLEKRKESVAVRAEITSATEEALDILGLVLEAVEEFVEMKVSGRKVRGMADRRWAMGILIQACLPLMADSEAEHPSPAASGGCGVARSLKERAAKVLEVWKGVLGGGEGSGGVGSGEATMFLQMVIGFGLKHKFDDEFLKDLVVDYAYRREMAKLVVALDFGHKMKGIIEELAKTGKEIEAVYFASEAGLAEQFPPLPLLKSSIRNYRKKKYKSSVDGMMKELSALRTIIKCMEDHKLESHFTNENLQNRVNELEKKRSDKKRPATDDPADKLRRRGRSSRPPKAVRLAMARQRNLAAERERQPPAATYGGGGATRSPARPGLQYAYPSQDVPPGAEGGGYTAYGY